MLLWYILRECKAYGGEWSPNPKEANATGLHRKDKKNPSFPH